MAPRPSSPTISYLPAFVTVSICLAPAEFGWRLRKNPPIRSGRPHLQAGYRPELREPRVDPQVCSEWTRVRRHPGTLLSTVPSGFSGGQRYSGTSVSDWI